MVTIVHQNLTSQVLVLRQEREEDLGGLSGVHLVDGQRLKENQHRRYSPLRTRIGSDLAVVPPREIDSPPPFLLRRRKPAVRDMFVV